ncbi:MAG TPA: intradiol ring-cleavage dioxygenase [Cytophagales bacterium]|nr:intradiol ring-cleavage dioxygenase [Cytophagales bacterium]HAP58064.1 intradiol ring-cleavage dioxygenase [Cytophagales bacterium]
MKYSLILLFGWLVTACQGQPGSASAQHQVGGPCQDCEALLDFRLLAPPLTPTDTLPGYHTTEPRLKITGTVYQQDGKTPAKGIIVYVYHTNQEGIYQPGPNPVGWETRHGQYRGWMKTSAQGQFTYYTFRPAAYPNGREPEHIHIYVQEPDTNPFYLDSYYFTDDPLLTDAVRRTLPKRGGSGIVSLKEKNGHWTAHRDIILGLNIPDYE